MTTSIPPVKFPNSSFGNNTFNGVSKICNLWVNAESDNTVQFFESKGKALGKEKQDGEMGEMVIDGQGQKKSGLHLASHFLLIIWGLIFQKSCSMGHRKLAVICT